MIIGLVGKPSSGKSTFFKASTLADVAIASYPFTTIAKNVGVGFVKIDCVDQEFKTTCNPREGFCINSKRFVPVELLDVAGLVSGSHLGKGRGNKFLNDLREADVLIHVIDASGSTDEQGRLVDAGSHDPVKDVRFLESELDLWYLSILKKPWEKFAKQTYMEHHKVEEAIATQFSGLNATSAIVKNIILKLNLDLENPLKWSEGNLEAFAVELRKVTKPIIIAANKSDLETSAGNIENLQEQFSNIIVPCSSEAELALKEAAREKLIQYTPGNSSFEIIDPEKLSDKQKTALAFIQKNVLSKYSNTGIQDCLNKAVFELLKRVAVFPVATSKLTDQNGKILPDCLILPGNSTALDLAFKLHTDFGKNFIKAIDLHTKKPIGKEHILKNGDVIEIISKK